MKVEPLPPHTVPLLDQGVRMPAETELAELAASALRKAIRHFHAGCGHYSEWELVLHQPAVSHDPRDPLGPAVRGYVRIAISVPKAWQDKVPLVPEEQVDLAECMAPAER